MVNARGAAIDAVRRDILRGTWRPGERLPLAELAERYGTSTTVVREALSRLAGNGLVNNLPNRGFFIKDLNLRELADLTELRCVSEGLAAELSLSRGDMKWEADLVAVHHQLANTPRRDPHDPTHLNEQWQVLHKNFHIMLLSACDCQPMVKLASDLSDATELYRAWAAPYVAASARDVEKEHKQILDAALARDATQLTQLLREHYTTTVTGVLESGLAG